MIRVELLHGRSRQVPPWAGPVLFALVLCGGLYGLNWFYPFGPLFDSSSQDTVANQELWREEANGVTDSVAAEQSAASAAWAEGAAGDSWANDAETAETAESSGGGEAPKQQVAGGATGWDEAPVQEPMPVVQETPVVAPREEDRPASVPLVVNDFSQPVVGDGDRPDGLRPPPRRSTACYWAVSINERVPPGVRLVSLTCSATGEYGLEGTSASQQSLRAFSEVLQKPPSQVTLSSWQEGKASARVLRFAFDGRFSELPVRELATLSSDQAARLFGKVARWADESGLDGLLIKKNITMPLPPARIHQRQKLWGTGSYQQIGAFLQKLQQVEEIAVLGEVVLMPIQGDEQGWAEARLYAAVDVVVGMP
ncbi:MAG: hypothetical protein HOI20_00410 [Gemmatimonadetes bacterium]|jgi:hypothetical protein|nr:hypothetical protein [Gemmatimonadota bacterium]MBT5800042.1 hypothetical protein [Gemmatimonadota bacterium]MBT6620574.1 hypothetical protein [Gemmatimonadota bacterium]